MERENITNRTGGSRPREVMLGILKLWDGRRLAIEKGRGGRPSEMLRTLRLLDGGRLPIEQVEAGQEKLCWEVTLGW